MILHKFPITRSAMSAKQRVCVIVCHRCGTNAEMTMNNNGGTPHEASVKYFRNKGWDVAKRRQDDECPSCQARDKAAGRHKPEREITMSAVKLVPAVPSPPPVLTLPVVAEPPRVMSREERRIVFEKLNEVYVNEKTGYAPGWTDDKVAKDLGTPRAWVSQVRDEMFGPAGSNPEITEIVTEAREVLAAMRSEVLSHRKAVEKAYFSFLEVQKRADAIEKKVVGIEKQVGIRL